MPSFNAILQDGIDQLKENKKETRIATILMEDLFNMDSLRLLMDGHLDMTQSQVNLFYESIKRTINNEPVQYVTGIGYFYGRPFKVTPDTLIPRNETEELVELILQETTGGRVVDVGTGTGAIGITLKLENPKFDVILTDISKEALKIASYNMRVLDAECSIYYGDLFEPLIHRGYKVDILVSNPPYISESERETMSSSVLKYEPQSALFAKEDGLYFYRKMIEQFDLILNNRAKVFFEIGWREKEPVMDFVVSNWPNSSVRCIKDINGNDRIIYVDWVR